MFSLDRFQTAAPKVCRNHFSRSLERCAQFVEVGGTSDQGWAKIKSWFDLNWFDLNGFLDLLIWFDLIWHIILTTWFDLIWRLFKITWFDLIWRPFCMIWFDLIWICEIIIDLFFKKLKSWVQAKPMAPMERARWELSIGAMVVYETIIDLLLVWVWLHLNFWFETGIKSRFDFMIWNELRQ